MSSQVTYFQENRYRARYHLGDRVSGFYNGHPFVGTVAIDTELDQEVGPKVVVFLDLPLLYNDKTLNMITVLHDDIKPLKEFV